MRNLRREREKRKRRRRRVEKEGVNERVPA
jgi:hypothetical protein